MPVTQMMSVVGRGVIAPPGPITPQGSFLYNSASQNWGSTNAVTTTYGAYTFPDTTTGSVHTLTGTQYLISNAFGNSATLNINLWFYPALNNVIVLDEVGQAAENTNWHYTMLEIDNSNKLKGRFWGMSALQAITSTGNVNLNAWNHVYLYFNNSITTIGMSLNNETAVTQNIGSGVRHVSDTGFTHFGIGVVDTTYMVTLARYQGKFDNLSIDTSITSSTYTATKAKYGF
jgi:hypothetical protein